MIGIYNKIFASNEHSEIVKCFLKMVQIYKTTGKKLEAVDLYEKILGKFKKKKKKTSIKFKNPPK